VLYRIEEGFGAPIVLVHGFSQTLASWDPVAAHLATFRHVIRVDLPGHGGSAAVHATLEETARMLGETCGPATYVGYSLGGRVCLRLAADRPQLVRALALIGASPGISDAAERSQRAAEDVALAESIEREGVAAFMQTWLARPMFAGVTATPDRLRNPAEGLAQSLRLAGAGSMEPLWDRLGSLRMPVQLIVGERDAKFREIARRMRAELPNAERIAVVHGAGHAAHLEDPAMVAGFIERFIVRHASVTS
jgi:2-succinyl-6-hydroxy-2,4-cyclohexadiene-1-carboxylate synthase